MATKIGSREILAMQPGTIIWDDVVRGFNARRQFSEIVTFSVYFRTQEGQQRFFKIGRFPVFTPTEARKQAIRILQNVALGKDPSAERQALRSAPTISELCDEYSAKMSGKKATTIKSDNSRIKQHIKPKIGRLKVTSITRDQIEEFMHSMSPQSGKRTVALLGAILTYAVKRKLRPDNPVHGIEKPKDNKRMRRLSVAEYAQLGSALNGDNVARDIFHLLVVSGWRSGEARLLKFSELDLDRRIATLGDTKSGQSVRPLSNAAIEIIQEQKRTSEYVFGLHNGQPLNKLDYHWSRLGLDKTITPHTLRHSFASLAADMLIPDHLISGLLGHARNSVTSRYTHLSDRALIETADRVAEATLKLMRSS
jgi:integrase